MKAMRLVRFLKQPFFCMALFLLSAGPTWGADAAGKILKIKGSVFIEVGKNKKAAVEGDKFFVGDTFSTGTDGRAKLQFAEGGPAGKNEVVVASSTRLLIEKAGSAASGKTGTSLALVEGSIRSNVKKKYSGEGEDVFKVKTPNAVAGVRGTIFMLNFDKKSQSSTLLTQKGKVEFAMGERKAFVGAGQVVRGDRGGVGSVQSSEKANLPGDFKELDKEGSGGPGPAGDSGSSTDGAQNGGAGEAPPAALDRETVQTTDDSSSTSASNDSGSGDTQASADSKTSGGETSAGSNEAPAAGDSSTAKTSDSGSGRTPAGDSAPAPDASGGTTVPVASSGGIISGAGGAAPPPPPPIFMPPPLYVPPITPVTVNQVKQADPNGLVKIPIKDFP